jgi:hypothetical protein
MPTLWPEKTWLRLIFLVLKQMRPQVVTITLLSWRGYLSKLTGNIPHENRDCGFEFTLSESQEKEFGAEIRIEVKIAGGDETDSREAQLCPIDAAKKTDEREQHNYIYAGSAPNLAFCNQVTINGYYRDKNFTLENFPPHITKLALCCSFFETEEWPLRNQSLCKFFKQNGYFVVNVHALGHQRQSLVFHFVSADPLTPGRQSRDGFEWQRRLGGYGAERNPSDCGC